MAKHRSRELIRADQFHAKVVELLRTQHADWNEFDEGFLLDNAQRPRDFIYSDKQWLVLDRLVLNSQSFSHYNDHKVQELLTIAYQYRLDLDEDAQEFLETLKRWNATNLKRRQIIRLAGLARVFAEIGRDDLDRIEEENSELEKVFFTQPSRAA